jgi:hypothetical protein
MSGSAKKRPVTAAHLEEISGKTARYFQKLAKAGKLSFASQPGGPGTAIFYDLDGYHEWMAKGGLGKSTWRKSTGATVGRGRARKSKEWTDGSPLELVLRRKLRAVSRRS